MALVPTRAGSRARAPALVVLALAVVSACNDTRRVGPVALPGPNRTTTYQDSINRGLVRAHSSVAVSVAPKGSASVLDATSVVSLTPSNHIGSDQPQTIVGITSGPVQRVTVIGTGAILCNGSYGSLIGYDSVGTVLGQTALTLTDPADCSPPEWPDNLTYGARATLAITTGTIARFEITPMSPLSGDVWDPPNQVFIPGFFGQTYSISVGGGTAPRVLVSCSGTTRGSSVPVKCTTTLSEDLPFTIVLRSAQGDRYLMNDSTRIAVSAGGSNDWSGTGVASASLVLVTAEVSVNGATTRITNDVPASFIVARRTWPVWNVNTISAVHRDLFEIQGLTLNSTGGPFQGFGDLVLPDTATFPMSPPTGGPNQGLRYLNNTFVINSYEIWIHPAYIKPPPSVKPKDKNILPHHAWYLDQNGVNEENVPGAGTCTQSNMASILVLIELHEGVTKDPTRSHWGVFNGNLPSLKLEAQLEEFYGQMTEKEFRSAFHRFLFQLLYNTPPISTQNIALNAADTPVQKQIPCTFDYRPPTN